ncbi:hypothetical protein HDU83_002246 [Entophlyctis luteolus]|nr:hypothetical protein HDU83_002246 [Entophlyctis luteolus]
MIADAAKGAQTDSPPTMTIAEERAKIYGTAPQPVKTPQEPFLPRVAHLAANNNVAANPADQGPMQKMSQADFVLGQMDRLRAIMREKEIDILKLRHENILLKQIERRQQKEIEQFELKSHDAPKIIRGLRDEISGLKSKIKEYYNQMNCELRRSRQMNDECVKLRDSVSRLQHLTSSQSLLEREELTNKVTELERKLESTDSLLAEASRKSGMVEKLLNSENRMLRGKIHNLTAENSFLKDKIRKLTDTIQDRDKEIASLSIYRYNAVHRKVEAVACKKCEQREKHEAELRKKQAIFEKIPKLAPPNILVTDGSTVQAVITAPYPSRENQIQYQKLTLRVSTDPAYSTVVKEYDIPIKTTSDSTEEEAESFTHNLTVSNLACGKYYHFSLLASCEGIDGNISGPVSVLVDQLPSAPGKPYVAHSICPPSIEVFVEPASEDPNASPPTSYQIYHSNDPSMAESFLIGEISAETGKKLKFSYNDVRIGTTHCFKVASVNAMGIGEFSEVSDVIVMDVPPSKPLKPHVRKIDHKSLHLSSSCEPHGGTDIDLWKIIVEKAVPDDSQPITFEVAANGSLLLDYEVNDVLLGDTFVFRIIAKNMCGESEASESSEPVNLDMMVPTPEAPEVEVLTSTSVGITFCQDVKAKYGDQPNLIGYNILGSRSEAPEEVWKFCGIEETYFVFDGLEIGENAPEGEISPLTAVNLAAGIPLPASPACSELQATSSSSDLISNGNDASEPGQLKKSKSRSLSLTQRSQNMHDGNPAYHDPEGDHLLMVDHSVTEKAGLKRRSNVNLKPSHGAGTHGKPLQTRNKQK